MFTMTALSNFTGSMTLALAGNVSEDALPEIDRLIHDGTRIQKQVALDLSEVTLMDRAAARFFAQQAKRGIELVNCPIYLKHWISRETTHEPEH